MQGPLTFLGGLPVLLGLGCPGYFIHFAPKWINASSSPAVLLSPLHVSSLPYFSYASTDANCSWVVANGTVDYSPRGACGARRPVRQTGGSRQGGTAGENLPQPGPETVRKRGSDCWSVRKGRAGGLPSAQAACARYHRICEARNQPTTLKKRITRNQKK